MDTKEFEKLSKAEQREYLVESMVNQIDNLATVIRDFIAGVRFREGDEEAEKLMQTFVSAFAEKLKESRRMSGLELAISFFAKLVEVASDDEVKEIIEEALGNE